MPLKALGYENKSAANKTPWSNPLLAISTQKASSWNPEFSFGHISRKTGTNNHNEQGFSKRERHEKRLA